MTFGGANLLAISNNISLLDSPELRNSPSMFVSGGDGHLLCGEYRVVKTTSREGDPKTSSTAAVWTVLTSDDFRYQVITAFGCALRDLSERASKDLVRHFITQVTDEQHSLVLVLRHVASRGCKHGYFTDVAKFCGLYDR